MQFSKRKEWPQRNRPKACLRLLPEMFSDFPPGSSSHRLITSWNFDSWQTRSFWSDGAGFSKNPIAFTSPASMGPRCTANATYDDTVHTWTCSDPSGSYTAGLNCIASGRRLTCLGHRQSGGASRDPALGSRASTKPTASFPPTPAALPASETLLYPALPERPNLTALSPPQLASPFGNTPVSMSCTGSANSTQPLRPVTAQTVHPIDARTFATYERWLSVTLVCSWREQHQSARVRIS